MLLAVKAGHQELLAKSLKQVSLIRKMSQGAIDCCLQELDFHMPISDPLTYVSKIAEKTGISGKTQGAAIAILRRLDKNGFRQEKTQWD